MTDTRIPLAQSIAATTLKMDAGAWISTQLIQHARPLTEAAFRTKWGDEAGDAYASLLTARAAMDRLVDLARRGDLRPSREQTDD